MKCPPDFDRNIFTIPDAKNSEELFLAKSEYERENYSKAFSMLSAIAEKDNAEAQHMLATMYGVGLGAPENKTAAYKWYKRSAEHGFAPAQRMVGSMYLYGDGGYSQDFSKALHWLTLAANKNDPVAQLTIGRMYFEGIGVPKNFDTSMGWVRKAAKNGDEEAQFMLADAIYAKSKNSVDILEAQKWFYCSARYGYIPALFNLGVLHEIHSTDLMTAYMYFYIANEGGAEGARERLDEVAKNLDIYEIAQAEETALNALSTFKPIWEAQSQLGIKVNQN